MTITGDKRQEFYNKVAHPYQPPFARSGRTRVKHESLVAFAPADGEVGQHW